MKILPTLVQSLPDLYLIPATRIPPSILTFMVCTLNRDNHLAFHVVLFQCGFLSPIKIAILFVEFVSVPSPKKNVFLSVHCFHGV